MKEKFSSDTVFSIFTCIFKKKKFRMSDATTNFKNYTVSFKMVNQISSLDQTRSIDDCPIDCLENNFLLYALLEENQKRNDPGWIH